jgi:hypothetical protein
MSQRNHKTARKSRKDVANLARAVRGSKAAIRAQIFLAERPAGYEGPAAEKQDVPIAQL